MEKDMSIATNNWIMQNPEWDNYKGRYWTGYYGSNYFLRYKEPNCMEPETRFFIKWPKIAEHFYALDWRTNSYDTIFVSYKLSEIERFINMLGWKTDYEWGRMGYREPHRLYNLRVQDLATKQLYKIYRENGIVKFVEVAREDWWRI